MKINIETNFDLKKLDIDVVNMIWLKASSSDIRWQAQDNAPYQTWKLRQSIWTEPGIITPWTKSVKIWPRKVVYAIRREFENFKNPTKKFYMKRAYDTAEEVIKREFTKAVNLVIKKIKK
jgi:hypothetical protein